MRWRNVKYSNYHGQAYSRPGVKKTQSGTSVTSFTVAVDRRFQQKGEEKQTDFINVVAWRQTAEFIEKYFSKGSMIAIRGSIQTRAYEDKNGNKRTAVEVVADEASFCGSKGENAQKNAANNDLNDDFEEIPVTDDLPF